MNTAMAQPIAQHDRSARTTALIAWGCFILGALLLPLATLQTVVPLAAWLAPLLLLRFVRARPGRVTLLLVVIAHQAALAVVICYDADYPDLIRQAGRTGAAMLLIPSFDWEPIRYRHPQMASFRAIENGKERQ